MKAAACSICNQRLANNVCLKCGSYVCDRCYDKATSLCLACRRGKVFK